MNRPIPPLFFVGVFLIILVAAVLMLATVMGHRPEPDANSTPRVALGLQLALLAEGNTAGLRLTFIETLRPSITPEVVEAVRTRYESVTLESLVGRIERGTPSEGVETAAVYTPNGARLTGLVLVDGDWLAESLWFLQER